MLHFDLRTLIFLATLTSVLLAVGLQLIHHKIATEPGLQLWSRGTAACGAGYVLLAFRGVLPDLISIVVANVLLIVGSIGLYLGNRRFFELKRERPWYWLVALAGAAGFAFFTYLSPDLSARIFVFSIATASILFPSAVVLLRSGDDSNRSVRWFLAMGYLLVAVFMLLRVTLTPLNGSEQDFLGAVSPVQTLSVVFGIALNMALGIGLPLLVSGRLQQRLSNSEVHLKSILDSASVGISFVKDRNQVWVNNAMCAVFGYAFDEIVNRSTRMFYVSQEAYETLGKQADSVLSSGGRFSTELEMLHRDGRHIWMCVTGSLMNREDPLAGSIWIHEEITERKQAEHQIREALAFNEAILRNSPVAMGVYLHSGPCVHANQAFATMVGATLDELLKQDFHFIEAWRKLGLLDAGMATVVDGKQRQLEGHVTTSFGREVWLEAVASRTILNKEVHLLVQFFDRTEQKRNEDALRSSEERLAMALAAASQSIWDIDISTDTLRLDKHWGQMMGGAPIETITTGNELIRLTHPDDVERAVAASLNAMKGPVSDFQVESRIRTPSGDWRWIRCSGKVVERDAKGRATRAIGTNLDVTEQRAAEELIRHLAFYDPLTNLPNRRLMLDRLDQVLSQSKRHKRTLAILFLDLDGFKNINDTLGHDAGDELLKVVSERLIRCVRAGDTVSRQGGDEFVILLTEIGDQNDFSAVAEKILSTLAMPVDIGRQQVCVTTSIGISHYTGHDDENAGDLLKNADTAMYEAKKAGRNNYRVFVSGTV